MKSSWNCVFNLFFVLSVTQLLYMWPPWNCPQIFFTSQSVCKVNENKKVKKRTHSVVIKFEFILNGGSWGIIYNTDRHNYRHLMNSNVSMALKGCSSTSWRLGIFTCIFIYTWPALGWVLYQCNRWYHKVRGLFLGLLGVMNLLGKWTGKWWKEKLIVYLI